MFQARAHEGQMRVAIDGLALFFARTQFMSQPHTVMGIAGIRGEQLLKDPDKLPELFLSMAKSGTPPFTRESEAHWPPGGALK